METTPVDRIETVSATPQDDEETIKEYVRRVGEEHDVEQYLIDGALAYVTEYYYSANLPEDGSEFEAFLAAVDESSEGTPQEPERADDEKAREDSPSVTPPETIGATGSTDFKTGIRGKEPRKLIVRFLVIVVTAPALSWMFARAWVPGNLVYDQGRALLSGILGIPGVEATKLFVLFGFGIYLGLLTLFTIDIKKRVQAMLLWIGTGLTLVGAALIGWVIPRVSATQLNVLGFLLGLGAGLVVELDQWRNIDIRESSFRRPTLSDGTIPEFRYAAGLLFSLLAIVVVATLGQVILAGTVRVFDPVVSVVFLFFAFQFVSYESETSYATLGPERSGKSMLMLGLCLELLRNGDTHPDPNDYLQRSLERASNLQPDQEKWPIPSTAYDELKAATFEIIVGYYFPRRLELTALDYAGQHLGQIATLIDEGGATEDDESVPGQVVEWIGDTDTLLFILDVERLVYPEEFQAADADEGTISWGLDHYTTITENIDPDDMIIVATKCDILIDQGFVDPPQMYDSYDEFRNAITEALTTRPDVQELLATTGESTINPVYFVTERRDGTYVPYLDTDGNLVPVGYDHLINEMRTRQ